MSQNLEKLQPLVGHQVVVDVAAEFVYLGTLRSMDESFLELSDADAHDLRDSEGTRETYVLHSARDGIRRNRKAVTIRMDKVLSISRLQDVVDF